MTTFVIASLTGPSGVTLNPTDGVPFEVGRLNFSLSTLYFADPTPADTTNAQVQLQGQLSFNNVPLLSSVTANVNTVNYVIADHTGITITGATITRSFDFDQVTVDGSITVGYDKPSNTYTLGGDVRVTTKAQGAGQKVALNSVQLGVNASLVDGQLNTFGFDASGSFQVFGLTVSTVGGSGQPFTFQYSKTNQQYELERRARTRLQRQPNHRRLRHHCRAGHPHPGRSAHPAGRHRERQHRVGRRRSSSTGLTFQYDREKDQFEMYGELQLRIPTGDTTQAIAAQLGSSSNPGLVIVDGELMQINMGLTGSFAVFGLHLSVNNAGVQWQRSDNSFLIGGAFGVDLGVFQTTLALGSATNPGLQIVNGKLQLDNLRLEVDNATLGPVTLNQLVVSYAADGDSFDLGVAGKVTLPGGWTVNGTLDLVDGRVHDVALSLMSTEGIPIGDTGLFLTQLAGSINNLDNPASIVVTAHLAVTWGRDLHPVRARGQGLPGRG